MWINPKLIGKPFKFTSTFDQFLNEGLSDTVYHFTSLDALVNIVKEDAFYGTLAIGTSADLNINQGKKYFFSTTRSKSAGYTTGQVKFTLDGRRLNQKYKGAPVDYWQRSKDPNDYKNVGDYKRMIMGELEDRIFLDEPEIKQAGKYVKEIHIRLSHSFYDKDLQLIKDWAKKYSIQIFIYDQRNLGWEKAEQMWKIERGGIPIDQFDIETFSEEPITMEGMIGGDLIVSIIALLEPDDQKAREKLAYQLDRDDKEMLPKYKQRLADMVEGVMRDTVRLIRRGDTNVIKDWSNDIKAELHNYRTSREKNMRRFIKMLTQDMRKHKTNDIAEYIQKKIT